MKDTTRRSLVFIRTEVIISGFKSGKQATLSFLGRGPIRLCLWAGCETRCSRKKRRKKNRNSCLRISCVRPNVCPHVFFANKKKTLILQWWFYKAWRSEFNRAAVDQGGGYWPKLYQLHTWHGDFFKSFLVGFHRGQILYPPLPCIVLISGVFMDETSDLRLFVW